MLDGLKSRVAPIALAIGLGFGAANCGGNNGQELEPTCGSVVAGLEDAQRMLDDPRMVLNAVIGAFRATAFKALNGYERASKEWLSLNDCNSDSEADFCPR